MGRGEYGGRGTKTGGDLERGGGGFRRGSFAETLQAQPKASGFPCSVEQVFTSRIHGAGRGPGPLGFGPP